MAQGEACEVVRKYLTHDEGRGIVREYIRAWLDDDKGEPFAPVRYGVISELVQVENYGAQPHVWIVAAVAGQDFQAAAAAKFAGLLAFGVEQASPGELDNLIHIVWRLWELGAYPEILTEMKRVGAGPRLSDEKTPFGSVETTFVMAYRSICGGELERR